MSVVGEQKLQTDRGHPSNKRPANRVYLRVCRLKRTPHTNGVHKSALIRPWDIHWVVHTHTNTHSRTGTLTYKHTGKRRPMGVHRCCPRKWPLFYSKVSVHVRISKPGGSRTNRQMCAHRDTQRHTNTKRWRDGDSFFVLTGKSMSK